MNMKTINKAAEKFAEEKTSFRKDVLKEVEADNYELRRENSVEDFITGAQWRIDSVWHEDEPKIGGELCLLERRGGVYVLAYSYTSEGKFVYFDGLWGTGDMFMNDIIRYAYIKDLIPIKQENLDD